MAIKLLSSTYGRAADTILSDLSYAIEQRLVDSLIATYDLSGGTHATAPTLPAGLTDDEMDHFLTAPLSTRIFNGVYDYSDLATTGTPLVLSAGVPLAIPNDTMGAQTFISSGLPGLVNIYDVSTQLFDFSGLNVGDSVDIRADMTITTTSPNQNVVLELDAGIGAIQYPIFYQDRDPKSAGAHPLQGFNSLYMRDSNTLDNGARFTVTTDAAATLVVHGWYVRAVSRKGVAG